MPYLGLNYELMQVFHQIEWVYDQGFSGSNILLVVIGLHCLEKRSLNTFAFSLQFKINILLTRRDGILGALHLFTTLLIIFQSFTLFPKFFKYVNFAVLTTFSHSVRNVSSLTLSSSL